MLTLAALWIVFSVVAVGVGLLFSIEGDVQARAADRVFFAWWLGIATVAWTSFAIVDAMPLHQALPWLAAAAFGVALWGLVRSRSTWLRLSPGAWIGFVALALITAERSVAVGPLEDTGGYHWSIVQWYEDYGIPIGLGLFQWRLATHSAWLAFTALLDVGVLQARVATVANGLLFVGCLWFAAICAVRWIRGGATLADRFAVAAFAFLLQLIAKWDMRLSASPDIPVLLVAIVVCWKMLADGAEGQERDSIAVLAVLAAVATTIKLNAFPLLVVCGVLLWTSERVALRARLLATGSVAVVLMPTVAASWTSTGCVLFPISVGCFESPSAIGAAAAREYSEIIRNTARRDIGPGLVATLVGGAYLAWRWRALKGLGTIGPVAVALAGVAFTAFATPTTRFAAGYLTIVPALAVAHAAGEYPVGRVTPRVLASLRVLVVMLLALAIAVPLYKEFLYGSLRAREFSSWAERKRGDPTINAPNPDWWLLPNRLDYAGPYERAHAIDFGYVISPKMTCWNHPQPCASNPALSALPQIRLRDPSRGLAAGFERPH